MAVRLNSKDLKKLLADNKLPNDTISKPITRTARDRLNDAIDIMNAEGVDDKIFFNETHNICILEFQNIAFISNNDLLRIDNREIYKLKMGWHNRIEALVKGVSLEKWQRTKENKILIEFLYKTKNAQMYDPDAICSAFKAPLDGLVASGLIKDDNLDCVPLIIPRQEKTKNENSLYIVLSECPNIESFYTDTFKMVITKNNKT